MEFPWETAESVVADYEKAIGRVREAVDARSMKDLAQSSVDLTVLVKNTLVPMGAAALKGAIVSGEFTEDDLPDRPGVEQARELVGALRKENGRKDVPGAAADYTPPGYL